MSAWVSTRHRSKQSPATTRPELGMDWCRHPCSFQRRAPMAAGTSYSIRMNRSPWPGFKLPAVAPFKQVVQDAGQIMRGRAGAGQISGSAADGPAGIGVVVGPDPAGVVVDVQPTIKLAKQLRQPAGQHGQLGDQPVKLGRPGSLRHRGVAEVQADGAAFALADHLGLDTLAASTGYVAGWASTAAGSTDPQAMAAVVRTAAAAIHHAVCT